MPTIKYQIKLWVGEDIFTDYYGEKDYDSYTENDDDFDDYLNCEDAW